MVVLQRRRVWWTAAVACCVSCPGWRVTCGCVWVVGCVDLTCVCVVLIHRREQVLRFQQFIQENDAKRARAEAKAQVRGVFFD